MVRNKKNQNKSIKEAIIMKEQSSSVQNTGGLKPHLSSLAVWALSNFLANRYPGSGGLYDYVKSVFGYDQAFFVGCFMFLTYISVFWANATSIPLFARFFLNNALGVGYLYTVFGYEVYLGEAILYVHEKQEGFSGCDGGFCPAFYRWHHSMLCVGDDRPWIHGYDNGACALAG